MTTNENTKNRLSSREEAKERARRYVPLFVRAFAIALLFTSFCCSATALMCAVRLSQEIHASK